MFLISKFDCTWRAQKIGGVMFINCINAKNVSKEHKEIENSMFWNLNQGSYDVKGGCVTAQESFS